MSPKQSEHVRLFIPGPVEVRAEILDAQSDWMIGHRSSDFAALYGRMQPKLQQSFFNPEPGPTSTPRRGPASGSASRCAVRDDRKILHLTCGAFSERWAEVSELNGKQVDVLAVEWGQPNPPEQLAEALRRTKYDAVAAVMNETSTGVRNPNRGVPPGFWPITRTRCSGGHRQRLQGATKSRRTSGGSMSA